VYSSFPETTIDLCQGGDRTFNKRTKSGEWGSVGGRRRGRGGGGEEEISHLKTERLWIGFKDQKYVHLPPPISPKPTRLIQFDMAEPHFFHCGIVRRKGNQIKNSISMRAESKGLVVSRKNDQAGIRRFAIQKEGMHLGGGTCSVTVCVPAPSSVVMDL
jgi:hypothetical protein